MILARWIEMRIEILDFNVLKEEISPNNVLAISEIIAFTHTRFLIGYMGNRMQRLYADLYADIKHKNDVNHVFSDGYDLVHEGVLFLCEHYGEHINDVLGYNKKGKQITVRTMCVKKMMKLINRKSRDYYRNMNVDTLTPEDEPLIEMREEIDYDYTQCDEIVENLNLTDNMRLALECRMAGLSYPEIGRVLARTQSTVFEYFIKMRQRYTAIYERK